LKPLDDRRPLLFHGMAIRAFLSIRKAGRKRPCPAGTLYCFRCREPRSPQPGVLESGASNSLSGNIRAHCATCGTTMHRRARTAALPSILPGRAIQCVEGHPRLRGRSQPSLNCELERPPKPGRKPTPRTSGSSANISLIWSRPWGVTPRL
jgi:hypothetical protein